MKRQAKILLVHVSDRETSANPLALGFLKTYSDSVLGSRVASEIVELDLAACAASPSRAAAALAGSGPDIVGFSCYLWNSEAVFAVSRELKRRGCRARIVLGGPDASGLGARALRLSGADIVVSGEGELTFADLAERFLAGEPWPGTPGTIALAGGRPLQGPPRPRMENLDAVPSPYLAGLFDKGKYRYYVMETSRGCPFNCTFCVWTRKGAVKTFSLGRALADANWIISRCPPASGRGRFQPQGIFLADCDITLNPSRAEKFLSALLEPSKKRHLQWIVNCNPAHLTRRLAKAVNAECFELALGIDSVNPAVLRSLGRVIPPAEKCEAGLRHLAETAPQARVTLQMMLGLPGDTPEGFLRSLRWAVDAAAGLQALPVGAFLPRSGEARKRLSRLVSGQPRAVVQVFHMAVLPGSRYEAEAAASGVKWNRRPPYQVRSAGAFSPEGFDRCYEAIGLLESFSAKAFGEPFVRISDIRRVNGPLELNASHARGTLGAPNVRRDSGHS